MATPYFGHVIEGMETPPDDGPRAPSVDPFTRRPWAVAPAGDHAVAARAVAAARTAFDSGPWPGMGFTRRGVLLHRLADLVEEHTEELALADTRDMGKPISDSRGKDVPRAAQNLRFFADHARLGAAETYPMDSGHHAYSRYEPAGVVVAVSPWNYPLMLATWKIAPALAWGNTVVLKPSEETPASATILARLAIEAGLPPGVLNVVHGAGDAVGEPLVTDPRVDRVTFTGGTATGRAIATAAAANLTPVSLELGGKGASVVFADADLDQAVAWSIKAIFTNAGQICLAGSRLLVQRDIYDAFLSRFVAAAEALPGGDPTDPTTRFGPLASARHHRAVLQHVRRAEEAGARVVTGGAGEGWIVRPTVLTGVGTGTAAWREEIFGPVVTVTPFTDEKDAVRLANDTRYGLNAMLFTSDLSRAHRVAGRLRAGTVWVNCFFVRDLRAPFGGAAESGVGREGGTFSRDFFTEPKAVVIQVDEGDRP